MSRILEAEIKDIEIKPWLNTSPKTLMRVALTLMRVTLTLMRVTLTLMRVTLTLMRVPRRP